MTDTGPEDKPNIDSPPPEILASGEEAVRAWRASVRAEAHPLNEAKLILLGEGGVGKTSLARRLRNDAFRPDEQTTQGIDVSSFHGQVSGLDFRINMWDFGGQEILHSTHQLFLSRRSVYVIVLDARRESRPEYWVENASAFGGPSPVLLVVNKTDENPAYELNDRYLVSHYPSIVGVHRTSCLTGHGIAALRETIWDSVRELALFRVTWPRSWFSVRNAIELANRQYLDHDAYSDLCRAEGVTDEQEQSTLLEFLHDLGLVAYFPDVALQVLNPDWVTSAIYRIINSPSLSRSGGALSLALLKDILGSEGGHQFAYNANERRAILQIMKRFEICYDEIPNQTVLVPALLPVREPSFSFSTENALHIRCEYLFLPSSVFPRLLVRLHADAECDYRWRTGALLRSNSVDSHVLIRLDPIRGVIEFWLQGQDRWKLWETIHAYIEGITAELDGVEVSMVVPCPCEVCLDSRSPYVYHLRSLLARLADGAQSVVCERSDRQVSVSDLLPSHSLLGTQLTTRRLGMAAVFISYSSKDRQRVFVVAADMRSLGIQYWLDIERILPGDSISQALNDGLGACRTLVACLSANQVTSGWARAEYGSALAVFLSTGGKRVIPLILDDLGLDEMPSLLRDLRAVRFSEQDEYRRFLEDLVVEHATNEASADGEQRDISQKE